MTRRRLRRREGGWEATCPDCQWGYWSRSLPSAHTEAHHHTCRPTLGPRLLPPGATIVGVETTLGAYVDTPRTQWHRLEVWL